MFGSVGPYHCQCVDLAVVCVRRTQGGACWTGHGWPGEVRRARFPLRYRMHRKSPLVTYSSCRSYLARIAAVQAQVHVPNIHCAVLAAGTHAGSVRPTSLQIFPRGRRTSSPSLQVKVVVRGPVPASSLILTQLLMPIRAGARATSS